LENMNSTEYISIIDIIKILRKKIIFIMALTILCTGIMVAKVMLLTKPMYEANATAIIVKGGTSIVQDSQNGSQYTESDISLYKKIVYTYVQIAESNLIIEKTAEELKTYSSSEIRAIVTASPTSASTDGTQIIQLKAVSSNKNDIAKIANIYCKNFIEQSMSILPVGKIQVLDEAKKPIKPISGKIPINIAIGFLFGLLLSTGIVLFRYYLDGQKIRKQKQVNNILNIPVLVTIE